MSRFTRKNEGRAPCAGSTAADAPWGPDAQSRGAAAMPWAAAALRHIRRACHAASPTPLHWATSVPRATPSMRSPKPKTKATEATILTTFWNRATCMGTRVVCMPTNHPFRL